MLGKNSQYCPRKCLEVVEIPTSFKDDPLEEKAHPIFQIFGSKILQRDIKVSHMLQNNSIIATRRAAWGRTLPLPNLNKFNILILCFRLQA